MTACNIGMIGLGVMGRNLVLNMADHGFSIAGYNRHSDKVDLLAKEGGFAKIYGTSILKDFVDALETPRIVMTLVPAGNPVDAVINELLPLLTEGDLIIDGGNSYFKDTDRRGKMLSDKGIDFLGVGISGGEHGARVGPSIMPGGRKEAYEKVRPILEAVAATADGDKCVTYLGPGSAGHYVKMVHNGIEYGMMQLISETYHYMKQTLGLSNAELKNTYEKWNETELESFLIEISYKIFEKKDEETDKDLIDQILGRAKQKGTGKWVSQDAMDLQIPIPSIDMAVMMRNLSGFQTKEHTGWRTPIEPKRESICATSEEIENLQHALYVSIILTYAQGFSLLKAASDAYGYGLNLSDVARIWRGGCIIRSRFLETIKYAFDRKADLANLVHDEHIAAITNGSRHSLRKIVTRAIENRVPTPGMASALAYLDAIRSDWLPTNLIQAQRDYFGSHGYERVDKEGSFHTKWI
jgi:6-phosphogluconate dehydrogenase